MELAIRYEMIIRHAHDVNRLGIPAAHADTFRGLERNYIRYKENNDSAENDELLFQYAFDCGEVSTNLNNALWKFEKRFENKLSDQDKTEMDEIETQLINADMDSIDNAIEKIETLFKRHGLVA